MGGVLKYHWFDWNNIYPWDSLFSLSTQAQQNFSNTVSSNFFQIHEFFRSLALIEKKKRSDFSTPLLLKDTVKPYRNHLLCPSLFILVN